VVACLSVGPTIELHGSRRCLRLMRLLGRNLILHLIFFGFLFCGLNGSIRRALWTLEGFPDAVFACAWAEPYLASDFFGLLLLRFLLS
jgi:hypothetical protein